MMNETDPTGKTAHGQGTKLDDGKVRAGLLADFSLALLEVAKVCAYGAKEYSVRGWESVDNGIERYKNAQYRHMLRHQHEELHECWNLLAQIELKMRGNYDEKTKI